MLLGYGPVSAVQYHLQLTTVVNITLIQEGDKISVRSDSLGQDEQVLSLGLQIVTYLSMLEFQNPDHFEVTMPTLSARAQ